MSDNKNLINSFNDNNNKLYYSIDKIKGNNTYYVYHISNPNVPLKGSYGDKKHAIKFAARLSGITSKEYIKLKKDL